VPVHSVERKLAAILAADVVGYSRLMGEDEAGTLARLKEHRRELIDPKISEHKGRIVKTTGDGILIEFPSVVEAVACAVAVQRGMAERNVATPEEQRIVFRVGVNLGDIIIGDDNDIHGDGVNVAARLEGIAEPGGICVSGTVRDHIGDRLDLAFEDMGEQALKNIIRRVRTYRVRLGTAERTPTISPAETTPTLALPDKPSIAVLPFQNMSGDPEQDYFADGMVEEIITALSRIRWLFVIARNSSFTYKGQPPDVKQVGRELGVRYVLEGSVRKGGGRVRITVQLIEGETGTHLWADRFDGSLEDVFDLQDKIAISVAGVIEPALQTAETVRSAGRLTTDLTAYDAYLRAYAMVFTSGKLIPEALRVLEQAIERDPHYGPALAWAAVCCVRLCLDGTSGDPETDARKGTDFARRALQVAGDEPGTMANAAVALADFGEDVSAAMTLVDRALALNPSYARGWYISGLLRLMAGESAGAIEHAEAARLLSPRSRIGLIYNVIGAAHFQRQSFDEAVPKLLLAIQDEPNFPPPYRYLAACYAHMGKLDEARTTIARLRAITPLLTPSVATWRNPEHRKLYLSGLRRAAGEAP
jgi:TolB-like protein/class 3 adenylate cyclase/tetratricopeptide (TPR) repeat protein